MWRKVLKGKSLAPYATSQKKGKTPLSIISRR